MPDFRNRIGFTETRDPVSHEPDASAPSTVLRSDAVNFIEVAGDEFTGNPFSFPAGHKILPHHINVHGTIAPADHTNVMFFIVDLKDDNMIGVVSKGFAHVHLHGFDIGEYYYLDGTDYVKIRPSDNRAAVFIAHNESYLYFFGTNEGAGAGAFPVVATIKGARLRFIPGEFTPSDVALFTRNLYFHENTGDFTERPDPDTVFYSSVLMEEYFSGDKEYGEEGKQWRTAADGVPQYFGHLIGTDIHTIGDVTGGKYTDGSGLIDQLEVSTDTTDGHDGTWVHLENWGAIPAGAAPVPAVTIPAETPVTAYRVIITDTVSDSIGDSGLGLVAIGALEFRESAGVPQDMSVWHPFADSYRLNSTGITQAAGSPGYGADSRWETSGPLPHTAGAAFTGTIDAAELYLKAPTGLNLEMHMPKDFTVEKTTDRGKTWTLVTTVSDFDFTDGQERTFDLSQPVIAGTFDASANQPPATLTLAEARLLSYRYIRIRFTAGGAAAGDPHERIQISGFYMTDNLTSTWVQDPVTDATSTLEGFSKDNVGRGTGDDSYWASKDALPQSLTISRPDNSKIHLNRYELQTGHFYEISPDNWGPFQTERDPRSWVIEGSDNLSLWRELDTKTDELFPNQHKVFVVHDP